MGVGLLVMMVGRDLVGARHACGLKRACPVTQRGRLRHDEYTHQALTQEPNEGIDDELPVAAGLIKDC